MVNIKPISTEEAAAIGRGGSSDPPAYPLSGQETKSAMGGSTVHYTSVNGSQGAGWTPAQSDAYRQSPQGQSQWRWQQQQQQLRYQQGVSQQSNQQPNSQSTYWHQAFVPHPPDHFAKSTPTLSSSNPSSSAPSNSASSRRLSSISTSQDVLHASLVACTPSGLVRTVLCDGWQAFKGVRAWRDLRSIAASTNSEEDDDDDSVSKSSRATLTGVAAGLTAYGLSRAALSAPQSLLLSKVVESVWNT